MECHAVQKHVLQLPVLNFRKTAKLVTTRFLWGRIILIGMQLIPIPWCPQKTDGSSHFNRVERTSWNVLCVWWEVVGWVGGVETPRSCLWKCRPLPQVLERSREPGLKISWPSSTSPSGMRVTTCLLAQDADTHLSRNGHKKKKKRKSKRQCQIGETWQNQRACWFVR